MKYNNFFASIIYQHLVHEIMLALAVLTLMIAALPLSHQSNQAQLLERNVRQVSADHSIGSIDGDIFAVARCRVSCLMSSNATSSKFSNLADLMENQDPTASMCWETCQLLIENWWTWHYMCDQYRLCLPGCQKACQFVMNLRESISPGVKFSEDAIAKKPCSDTSNSAGFSNIKWTCDAQDTFRGCQISWNYPLIAIDSANPRDKAACSFPPEQSLVYVIFYNEYADYQQTGVNLAANQDGVFSYKQQTFRAAAMTFENTISLTTGDDANDGSHNLPDSPGSFNQHIDTDISKVKQNGFFLQIVAVSSMGIVANSQTLVVRPGAFGISPPYYPPARLTPSVILKNIDLGLEALLSWRYQLPFFNNFTSSGVNEIQLVWRRHTCNVEPTFPNCELVPRTWSIQLDPRNTSIEFSLPNLTYNSAYELYIAMAGANSSRVLINTPGCFTPDRTFRLCLPTTLTKELPHQGFEFKNGPLLISLVATSVVVVVTAAAVGLFLYYRLYRQTKAKAIQEAMVEAVAEPKIPPGLRSTNPGDDYSDYQYNPFTSSYHPRSQGRDSAYDSYYVGSIHQLGALATRDPWEISEGQISIGKQFKNTETIEWLRGTLRRESVWIKRLKTSNGDWRDHLINELAILKMLERHANILNLAACITSNSAMPVIVLEHFENSIPLNHYWNIIQRTFLHGKMKASPRLIRGETITRVDSNDSTEEIVEPSPSDFTLSLQPATQLDFMRQIAAGLAHIHSHQFTHGCLEPFSSVLISVEARLIKLTGIGSSSNLARSINSSQPDWHIERYLSPECQINNPIRTKQGDVWSFAVLCWQMASFGAQPYQEIPLEKLQQCIASGFKLEQPIAASNKLYEMLLRCWESQPQRRPAFQDILVELHTLLNSNSRHVDFTRILNSTMPSAMITPIMAPTKCDVDDSSRMENDDDSVFGGSTLHLDKPVLNLQPVVRNPMIQAVQKSVKIRTPSTENPISVASDHV